MKDNEFKNYIENYIENLANKNDKRKAHLFLDYLKEDFGDDTLETPIIFSILDKEYFLNSLVNYIEDTSPSRGVAEDYRRTIIELCNSICKKYNIKNQFLESVPETNDFLNTSKELIKSLKEIQSRECLSFSDCEILEETISNFLNTENLDDAIRESIVNDNYKPNYFERLTSVIAIKLVQKYGLANKTIANLNLSNLTLERRLLSIKEFELPIDEKLSELFCLYLTNRELVLSKNNTTNDILFLKKDGSPYLDINDNVDSGQLFLLLDLALKHTSTTKLRYKTIAELVSKNVNIKLLSKLTDVSEKTIVKLSCEDENYQTNFLYNIFNGSSKTSINSTKKDIKGQIQCPYCGCYKDASSENWILIQVNGDEKKAYCLQGV